MDKESDYTKKWNKARTKILGSYDMIHGLILMSRESGADYEYLLDKDPVFIVRNFIGKMTQNG